MIQIIVFTNIMIKNIYFIELNYIKNELNYIYMSYIGLFYIKNHTYNMHQNIYMLNNRK